MEFHSEQFAFLFVSCFVLYPWLRRGGQNSLLVLANIIFYLASGLVDSTLFACVLIVNYLLVQRSSGRPDWRTLFGVWAGANVVLYGVQIFGAPIATAIVGGTTDLAPAIETRHFIAANAGAAMIAVAYFLLSKLPARVSVWVAVLLNLGNLAAFKYFDFAMGDAASLSTVLGLPFDAPVIPLLREHLPLGISFYTFQIIAYQVDLWRGSATRPKHLGEYVLFIAFFPQLIAGPILRSYQFLPQLQEQRRLTMGDIRLGALFILWGFVKKVVFGDSLAITVDRLFADPANLQGLNAWFAAVGFSLQIYFDFSGYSDIAVGLGHMFGFSLPRNFHQPYLSGNPREFWQRWHVTLSRWLRDYLYISLGGNRGSKLFTIRNLLITMLLGGLWHGAAWTFVVWGALHGVWLALHRVYSDLPISARLRDRGGLAYRVVCHVGVLLMLIVTWVFFRAETVSDAMHVLRGMLTFVGGQAVNWFLVWSFLGLGALHLCEQIVFEDVPRASWLWHKIPAPGRGLVYAATWLLIVVFIREDAPFIYFRF